MVPLITHFWLRLDRRLGREERAWLEKADGSHGSDLIAAFSGASRRLGRGLLEFSRSEAAALEQAGAWTGLAEWRLDDLARAALLLSAADRLSRPELEGLVLELYQRGDLRQRQAVLRVLPYLRGGPAFLPVALDGCASPQPLVFEAIACANPYPRDHFSELQFCAMVARALNAGVRLERIFGLRDRTTPSLRRLAEEFAVQRRAAGRGVPADVERLRLERSLQAPEPPRPAPAAEAAA